MILGVSFDTPEDNAVFVSRFDFDFPLLSDTTHGMAVAYGAADDVEAQFADRLGVIVDPEGKIAHWLPSVSPKRFPVEALSLLPEP